MPALGMTMFRYSKNLGENVQLMLTFAHPGDGLFVDKFPLAWKYVRHFVA